MENVNLNENQVSENRKRRQSFAKIANDRLGETVMQNCNEVAFIVEYVNTHDITVQFKRTGELVKTEYDTFVRGNIKSHFTPSVYGVGVKGLEPIVDENGEKLDSYECWKSMLERCYSAKCQKKHPTYINCRVCDKWLFYPNFKNWYDKNYYKVDGCTMMLDKDIKVKGSKIYSPNTCMFVPSEINFYFTKGLSNKTLPTGVYYDKINKNYYSNICIEGKHIRLKGSQSTDIATTFSYYKKAKEEDIKRLADKYKDKIPNDVYEIIYNRTVDIND